LYGRAITTEFYTKLRDEKRFGGLAELMEAIRADAAAARAYFAGVEGARV
jgi:FAD synthase